MTGLPPRQAVGEARRRVARAWYPVASLCHHDNGDRDGAGRALRAAAASVRGKVSQRELIARNIPYVAGLLRAVPGSSQPAGPAAAFEQHVAALQQMVAGSGLTIAPRR